MELNAFPRGVALGGFELPLLGSSWPRPAMNLHFGLAQFGRLTQVLQRQRRAPNLAQGNALGLQAEFTPDVLRCKAIKTRRQPEKRQIWPDFGNSC